MKDINTLLKKFAEICDFTNDIADRKVLQEAYDTLRSLAKLDEGRRIEGFAYKHGHAAFDFFTNPIHETASHALPAILYIPPAQEQGE